MKCLPKKSIVLAITGGIACGKSEAGKVLETMGFVVCDADHVAHDLMKRGSEVYQQVVDSFGVQILLDDKEISRVALGKLVFENSEKREILNRLVHPAVENYLKNWIKEIREKKQNAAALIPLLFESGMESLAWSSIICVSSLKTNIVERLETRGLGKDEAAQRIASHLSMKEKEKYSDHVIYNNDSLEKFEKSIRETVKRIMAEEVL